jgi:FeS assembly SUF system protein
MLTGWQAMSNQDMEEVKKRIIKSLRQVKDPEIPVNLYDLGLIYDLEVRDTGHVAIRMTLTSPGCPVADMLVKQVESQVKAVEGVSSARVELVWEPAWTPDRMSEAARLELNLEPGQAPPRGQQVFQINRPK